MKKKISTIILGCFLILSLTGCVKNKEEEAPKKTEEEKINLNDNIYYYTDVELTNKDCGGFGFPTNVEEVIDKRWISSYGDLKAVDKMELYSSNKVVYDKTKENEAKQEWDKLENPSRGVKNFTKGYSEHELYFGYWYITLVKDEEGNDFNEGDRYYELTNQMKRELESFNKKTTTIIKERDGYRFQGTCGGPSIEILLLDEEVCTEYNLNCDRW